MRLQRELKTTLGPMGECSAFMMFNRNLDLFIVFGFVSDELFHVKEILSPKKSFCDRGNECQI
jgi:hypothetical protein